MGSAVRGSEGAQRAQAVGFAGVGEGWSKKRIKKRSGVGPWLVRGAVRGRVRGRGRNRDCAVDWQPPFGSLRLMLSLYITPRAARRAQPVRNGFFMIRVFPSRKQRKSFWNCDGAQRGRRANTRFARTGERRNGGVDRGRGMPCPYRNGGREGLLQRARLDVRLVCPLRLLPCSRVAGFVVCV